MKKFSVNSIENPSCPTKWEKNDTYPVAVDNAEDEPFEDGGRQTAIHDLSIYLKNMSMRSCRMNAMRCTEFLSAKVSILL